MAGVTIKASDNGPLRVKGSIELMDGEGNLMETKEEFALCRCGQSKNKPFCDGSHASTGFTSSVRAAKPM